MKRSKVPPKLLVHFFRSVVVPQLEHACPVWTTSITEEQKTMIESVQKRALKIIYPDLDYVSALKRSELIPLKT